MEQFLFRTPGKIVYGFGAIEHVGNEAKKYGKKAMIVSDRFFSKPNGILDKIVTLLSVAGVKSTVFAEVDSDPSSDIVEKGIDFAKAENINVIVALGGGSAIDVAKGISMMLTNPGTLLDYEKKSPEIDGTPIIAIPTTAGTGSEVSKFTVITDLKRKIKMVIGAEAIIPKVAILDPELTLSMPASVTSATGMDALTHAIESYISKAAQPITMMHSLTAVKLISESLVKAVVNPQDKPARYNMLIGQMHAGLAMSNSSTALVHSMSRPLGVYSHVPHGLANAILLPEVMKFNRTACPEKFADIAKAMGENIDGLTLRESSLLMVKAVNDLYAETGLPKTLKAVGVKRESLPQLAQDAIVSGTTALNPRTPTLNEIIQMYENIYE